VTLFSWDNATADPEMFTGYMLNPHLPFSSWKEKEIGDQVAALFGVADYDKRIAGYKEINKAAVEYGAIIPLLQAVLTVVSNKNIAFEHYKNGWVLANTVTKA
jgi:peptide/nickel transport system substrate-binding protein